MIFDIVPISTLQFEKVHYYTVRFENRAANEFRDFQTRMSNAKKDQIELGEINRYIEKIGKVYGASKAHFKDEDAAERLPPPYHQFIETDEANDFGLRLYCIRLSPSVVILLNGGRKTALKVRDCKNCYPHFDKARRISKKINEAILDGTIEIDEGGKEIVIDEDLELSI